MTSHQIATWTVPVSVFCVATLVALLVRQIVLRRLRHWTWLEAVRGPSMLWCVATGLALAIHNADAPPAFDFWAQKLIGTVIITSIGLATSSIAFRLVTVYAERNKLRIAGLSQTLINLFIFSLVLLMVMSQFNVQITPILTALGVGGLAVALALQDTLANFFAGIHILVEEPLRVGDFIRISKDEEGVVSDIGWRTTRIQTFQNTVHVIPNQKITSGILTNFTLPSPRVSAEVQILAAHHADAVRIGEIAIDVASRAEGVLPDFPPVFLLDPGVLPTHLAMKVVIHVGSINDRGPVQSRIRAGIHERFRAEGIPFPEVRS